MPMKLNTRAGKLPSESRTIQSNWLSQPKSAHGFSSMAFTEKRTSFMRFRIIPVKAVTGSSEFMEATGFGYHLKSRVRITPTMLLFQFGGTVKASYSRPLWNPSVQAQICKKRLRSNWRILDRGSRSRIASAILEFEPPGWLPGPSL